MKILIIGAVLALFAISAQAQERYSVTTGDVALTGTGTTLTIQQPAAPIRTGNFETATVYCSVACNVTQSVNGTAATTTAGTFVPLTPTATGSLLAAFTASNVGAGTAIGPIVHLGAGQTVVLDLSKLILARTAGANYSISISSITGTANITVIETELP